MTVSHAMTPEMIRAPYRPSRRSQTTTAAPVQPRAGTATRTTTAGRREPSLTRGITASLISAAIGLCLLVLAMVLVSSGIEIARQQMRESTLQRQAAERAWVQTASARRSAP